MANAFQDFDVVRVDDRCATSAVDRVASELPLEVRLEGRPFSVIMCTPGADGDLAAGFLFSESVIRSADEIRCGRLPKGPFRMSSTAGSDAGPGLRPVILRRLFFVSLSPFPDSLLRNCAVE